MDSVSAGLRIYSQPELSVRGNTTATPRVVISPIEKKKLVLRICQVPLDKLKRELVLNDLNKEMLRALAGRLTRTENHIKFYGRMGREELIANLATRGFQQ